MQAWVMRKVPRTLRSWMAEKDSGEVVEREDASVRAALLTRMEI
jgi:predicted transcriptional regulator